MPNVLLSTNTMGAEIRYSTDGNDVTEESTLYSGQFSVEAGATVKAKAFKTGMNPSPQSELASFVKLQTPTLSLSRSGSVINITLGNTVEGATYRYKVGSAPTSPTDGTAISGSATLDNSSALTIYVVGWMTGTYNPSDIAMDSVEQYVPTLQTPTLSLSRSGQTVTGTIGNTVSGATYVYKVDSAPSTQSDGTVISGTTFSFNNDNAVTVYVRGFMSGYNASSAASDTISKYQKPYPDEFEIYEGYLNSAHTNNNLVDIDYASNIGVYVAPRDSRYAQYSYDKINWNTADINPVNSNVGNLNGVLYVPDKSRFYMFGDDGVIVESTNGVTWDNIESGFGTSNIDAMAYGNGIFVIAGQSKISYMALGINYFQEVANPPSNLFAKKAVYWKNNFYIIGDNDVYRSSNGETWSALNIGSQISGISDYIPNNYAISDTKLVITYDDISTTSGKMIYTEDGTNFYECDISEMSNGKYGLLVAYGNGIFLAIADFNYAVSQSSGITIGYSTDGETFYKIKDIQPTSDSDYLPSGALKCLKYLNNEFISVGNDFETIVAPF